MPDRKNTRWMKVRLYIVVGLLLAGALIVLVRIWTLQVSQSNWLQQLSQEQYLKDISLEPMRGAIVDRNNAPMAVSVMTESIFAMPQEVPDIEETAKQLATALKIDARRLAKKLLSKKHFCWVKRRLDPKEAEKVKELKLRGIHFTRESRRFYPGRELAGSVIGFAGDGRGLEGIELLLDGQLRGATVLAQGLRDARGNLLFADGLGPHESSQGGGVVLTIDLTIQEIVETELSRAVHESRAKAGTAIVMDPKTGEILALANVPGFNPNTFWKYTPERWRNRAITDCFEPGSTMKIFTMIAALQEGSVAPDESFDCNQGSLELGVHTIHDSKPGGYSSLSLQEILVFSSNIGIAKVGMKLGKERLWKELRRFGFGQTTGIDLPGESHCVLHPPQKWSEASLATISFGQGISVTPIQLITAVSAIANKGVWMRPVLVKEIHGSRDEILQRFNPEAAGRVADNRWIDLVTHMMVEVTGPEGTGSKAAIAGFEVAGKTGTAQKADPFVGGYSEEKRVASFVGFVPARQPRIAVLVVIDEPSQSPFGGIVAAPAFQRIVDATLRYLGLFPRVAIQNNQSASSPEKNSPEESSDAASWSIPVAVSGLDPKVGVLVPEVRGLSARDALRRLSAQGLTVTFVGSGRVVTQQPTAGMTVKVPQTVLLELENKKKPRIENRDGTKLATMNSGKEGG